MKRRDQQSLMDFQPGRVDRIVQAMSELSQSAETKSTKRFQRLLKAQFGNLLGLEFDLTGKININSESLESFFKAIVESRTGEEKDVLANIMSQVSSLKDNQQFWNYFLAYSEHHLDRRIFGTSDELDRKILEQHFLEFAVDYLGKTGAISKDEWAKCCSQLFGDKASNFIIDGVAAYAYDRQSDFDYDSMKAAGKIATTGGLSSLISDHEFQYIDAAIKEVESEIAKDSKRIGASLSGDLKKKKQYLHDLKSHLKRYDNIRVNAEGRYELISDEKEVRQIRIAQIARKTLAKQGMVAIYDCVSYGVSQAWKTGNQLKSEDVFGMMFYGSEYNPQTTFTDAERKIFSEIDRLVRQVVRNDYQLNAAARWDQDDITRNVQKQFPRLVEKLIRTPFGKALVEDFTKGINTESRLECVDASFLRSSGKYVQSDVATRSMAPRVESYVADPAKSKFLSNIAKFKIGQLGSDEPSREKIDHRGAFNRPAVEAMRTQLTVTKSLVYDSEDKNIISVLGHFAAGKNHFKHDGYHSLLVDGVNPLIHKAILKQATPHQKGGKGGGELSLEDKKDIISTIASILAFEHQQSSGASADSKKTIVDMFDEVGKLGILMCGADGSKTEIKDGKAAIAYLFRELQLDEKDVLSAFNEGVSMVQGNNEKSSGQLGEAINSKVHDHFLITPKPELGRLQGGRLLSVDREEEKSPSPHMNPHVGKDRSGLVGQLMQRGADFVMDMLS